MHKKRTKLESLNRLIVYILEHGYGLHLLQLRWAVKERLLSFNVLMDDKETRAFFLKIRRAYVWETCFFYSVRAFKEFGGSLDLSEDLIELFLTGYDKDRNRKDLPRPELACEIAVLRGKPLNSCQVARARELLSRYHTEKETEDIVSGADRWCQRLYEYDDPGLYYQDDISSRVPAGEATAQEVEEVIECLIQEDNYERQFVG